MSVSANAPSNVSAQTNVLVAHCVVFHAFICAVMYRVLTAVFIDVTWASEETLFSCCVTVYECVDAQAVMRVLS